jgi:hypothetical protein
MARFILRALVVALALASAGAFTVSAIRTIHGRAKADPVEQSIVAQAKRFAARDFTYAEPTRPGEALLMPGFPAIVAGLVGHDVPRVAIVRALALAAILFTAFLLFFLVHFETGSWTLGLAAGGLFLFGQGLFANAPGFARPESLAFLLVLLAFGALRFLVGFSGSILAGILLALAWFIDAGAFVFMVAAFVSQMFDERRRVATLVLVSGLLIAAATIVLLPRLGPWFGAAAWTDGLERFDPRAAMAFATSTLLGKFGLFALALVLSFAISSRPWSDREGLWIWLGVAAITAGAFATQSGGGPAQASALGASVAALALLGMLALQRIVQRLSDRGDDAPSGEAVLLSALVIQFGIFASCAADAAWVRALSFAG